MKDRISIISDGRNSKIKDRVIMKIMRFQGLHMENGFKKWRENSRIMTVQMVLDKKLSDKTKTELINSLNHVMNTKKSVKTRLVLQYFHTSVQMEKIKKNIFKKLLYTNYG
jgi:hypothetical protein